MCRDPDIYGAPVYREKGGEMGVKKAKRVRCKERGLSCHG